MYKGVSLNIFQFFSDKLLSRKLMKNCKISFELIQILRKAKL